MLCCSLYCAGVSHPHMTSNVCVAILLLACAHVCPLCFRSSCHAWRWRQPTKCTTRGFHAHSSTGQADQNPIASLQSPPSCAFASVLVVFAQSTGISCCWNGSGASLTTSQSECDINIDHCCMTCVTVCWHNCAYLSAGLTGSLSLLDWQRCIPDVKPLRM